MCTSSQSQDRHHRQRLDNPTLARLIVAHQKPLEIKEGELVEPIGVRRNKTTTYIEGRFIAPAQKARQQMLTSIKMSDAPKGQLSVLSLMSCTICLAHLAT